jgi:Protein of unknown function (DUF2937)
LRRVTRQIERIIMGLITRSAILAAAALGLGVSSQAPEFAQQYRQRLGGAVDELRAIVEDFDRDAAAVRMDRKKALDHMADSQDRFFRERGQTMRNIVERYENLARQRGSMEAAAPIAWPVIVIRNPDSVIIEGAWRDFEPAVPLTSEGAIYGGFGALLLGLLAWLGIGAARKALRASPVPTRRHDESRAGDAENPMAER